MNPHRTGRIWTYRAVLVLITIALSALGSAALDWFKAGPPICYLEGGGS